MTVVALEDLNVVGFGRKFEFRTKGFVDGLGLSVRDNKVSRVMIPRLLVRAKKKGGRLLRRTRRAAGELGESNATSLSCKVGNDCSFCSQGPHECTAVFGATLKATKNKYCVFKH